LAALLIGLGFAPIARAQILGESSPGTPGAIDGELRGPRQIGFPPPLREAPIAQPAGSGRFTLQRRPNTAIRRAPGDLRQPGTDSTLTPMGQSARQTGPIATQRRPSDLTGTTFRDATSLGVVQRAPDRPPSISTPAPGLPPVRVIQPRRPALEQDPYAPVGIQAGSILLRPALATSIGYDSNATRSGTSRKGSTIYKVEGEVKASSDWSAHRLDVDLRGAYTGYTSLDNVNRPEGDARIALRLDATRDLQFDIETRARIDTESASNVNLPSGTSGRTPFYTSGASIGATQRFGNLSLGLRGSVDRSVYGDIDNGGTAVSQASRNLTGYALRLRAGYEITPGVTPFLEATLDTRRYDENADSSGFQRSSSGMSVRAGSTFELARTLTGEAALGYTQRNYEDGRLSTLRSPTADASLTWSVSPLTTLGLRAQTEIAETTLANSPGAVVYRGNVTLTHAFLRNLTATANFGLSETDYQRVSRRELLLTGGLRLEYKFSRLVALRGSYLYENQRVNVPGSSYQAHTFLLGMRLTP
jgi:hypothetical protein